VVKQKREIKKLKRELKGVLKRLDSMEMSIDSANIQQDIEDDSDWNYITVTVKRGDTLSKYAKRYYGDRNSYYREYIELNRDKIGKDLMLHIGDRIIIPIGAY